MNKIAAFTIITLLLAGLTACGSASSRVKQSSAAMVVADDVAATIELTEGGISVDTEITINNLHPGVKVAVNYKVVNKSGEDKQPVFYLNGYANVKDYEMMASTYDNPPAYVAGWITFPEMTLLPTGESAIYAITFAMPEGNTTEGLPRHFAFQIGASTEAKGGYQTAIGQWWLVNLR